MMKNPVRVLGIIPARGGSKRIPRKNIVSLAGKPLLSYAVSAAQESKALDAFIVSTDDAEIAALASSLGADVPFLRPKKLAADSSRDITYVRHALSWVKRRRGWKPEIIVLLPPDVPFRTGKDIDAVVEYLERERLDSVRTLVGPILHPPCKALWRMADARGPKGASFGSKRIVPLFPQYVGKPRQEIPPYYVSVGLAYATRTRFVERGTLWGKRIGGYVVEPERGIEIDEPEQLAKAEAFLRKRP